MPGPNDVSTSELKLILQYGVNDVVCHPERVTALIEELLRERERADEAVRAYALMRSEMEMVKARSRPMSAHSPDKPEYKDGVRQWKPRQPPPGPDGFPQRGIIN